MARGGPRAGRPESGRGRRSLVPEGEGPRRDRGRRARARTDPPLPEEGCGGADRTARNRAHGGGGAPPPRGDPGPAGARGTCPRRRRDGDPRGDGREGPRLSTEGP